MYYYNISEKLYFSDKESSGKYWSETKVSMLNGIVKNSSQTLRPKYTSVDEKRRKLMMIEERELCHPEISDSK